MPTRLNNLSFYILNFPEEIPKKKQKEVIELLDPSKNRDPEWHEAMINDNIDILEMSFMGYL
jgi:hypothetical protein